MLGREDGREVERIEREGKEGGRGRGELVKIYR